MKLYEDLNIDQRNRIESKTGYTIPWDVVWKESSISTPARTVFDASSRTSTGVSLNDVLATGIPDLVRLLDVLLDWHIGPAAFVGDVSQFYCSIGLEEKSWPYQKLLLKEDLNPNGKLIKAVIMGAKTPIHILIILVGTGSAGPDLQDDSIISLRTSSNVSGAKLSKGN